MSSEVLQPSSAKSCPDYVITLVHGTFARNAVWPRAGSALRNSVAAMLAPASIEFAPFVWSGGNSHRDRVKAGLALRRFLRDQAKLYPNSKRFLIAHSHGGNVTLYGLRFCRPRFAVDGVICLGTPFLHFAPNDVKPIARIRRRAVASIAVFVALFGALEIWARSTPLELYSGIFLLAIGLSLWVGTIYLYRRDLIRLTRSQARLLRHVREPRKLSTRFLCVNTSGDEAKLVLDISDATAKVSGGAIGLTSKLLTIICGIVALGGLALWAWAIWLLILANQQGVKPGAGEGPGHTFAAIVLSVAGAVAVVAAVATLWTNGVLAHTSAVAVEGLTKGIAYGRLGGWTHSLIRVIQKREPPGEVLFTLERFNVTAPGWSLGKRHSNLYTDAAVLDRVSSWIRSTSEGPLNAASSSQ